MTDETTKPADEEAKEPEPSEGEQADDSTEEGPAADLNVNGGEPLDPEPAEGAGDLGNEAQDEAQEAT